MGHYSLQGSTVDSPTAQRVYQIALDYENGPVRVGYARVAGKSAPSMPVQRIVTYDNLYANYNYGPGKVYLVYIRSNNNGPTAGLFNGSSPLGNTGALIAGTDVGAETYYKHLSGVRRLHHHARVEGRRPVRCDPRRFGGATRTPLAAAWAATTSTGTSSSI